MDYIRIPNEKVLADLKQSYEAAWNIYKYFELRDRMNAEIHRESGEANVRYSPITIQSKLVRDTLGLLLSNKVRDIENSMQAIEHAAERRSQRSLQNF